MSPLITLLIQFGLQYGPEAVQQITALLNNKNATIADVQAAFANLKPYSAYGIPATVPTPVVVNPSLGIP